MSTMTLPSVDATPPKQKRNPVQPVQPPVEPERSPPKDEDNYQMSMAAFVRVDVKLPIAHRVILRDKLRKLQDSGAKLQDGTDVTDKTKAVLWILENEVT